MKLRQKLERMQHAGFAAAPRAAAVVAVPNEDATSHEPRSQLGFRAEGSSHAQAIEIGQRMDVSTTQRELGETERAGVVSSLRMASEERERALSSLRARLDAMQSARIPPRVPPRELERTLPCAEYATQHGKICRQITEHEIDHHHGSAEVVRGCRVHAGEVALLALDPALEGIDFSRALYIDTETTGLAGGSGTLPFLIGMAWFEDERLIVEQLFLPRPGLEGPLLARLAERMQEASAVVSYNGKSFDWPLLRTRFILNRVPAPKLPAHLDLLHCARRVYKARLGSVRLIHLEQALLGFERIEDIPGELIPQTYFAYLRGETAGSTLKPILEHNRSDLVALPALLGEILRRFSGEHAQQDARDKLGFAKVAARAESNERAIELAHAAADADLRGELASTALYLVGELKLQKGDLLGAVEAFERAVELGAQRFDAARAHLALAKLHERKTKELVRALSHAQCTGACEGEEASARRVARLRSRIQKRGAA